ncbi:hypothetical protein NQ317_003803 [Molorchus minor]|uniref:Uncharacterized protein n=1 Tax=Molorchus minor TaxID=1323400 RepID=A0ABQ9ISL6_9CUCU|nr:hypothetical protein NQ317_003803 [Molorchus minor]
MSFESNNELFRTPPYCKTPSRFDPEVFEDDIPLLKLEVADPGKVLQLCEDLTERCTRHLEVKINKYMKSQSNASMVFLINLLTVSEEAVVQVVTDKLSETTISNIVEFKDHCFKCPEVLDLKIQGLINDVVPEDFRRSYDCSNFEYRKKGESDAEVVVVES